MSHPRTTSRSIAARFLGRGPLERLPKREDDRLALLELVARQVLPLGEDADEPGLNLRLRAFGDDTAMLRRALVDHGLVSRSADGSRYEGVVELPPLVIRPAGEADDAEINRITVAAYLTAGYFPDARTGYMQKIQDAAGRRAVTDVWVAERGEEIIAAVTLAEAGNAWADVAEAGELEFRLLVVDPHVQRSGAGRAIVAAILDEARRREGIASVVLTTNAEWEGPNALYPRLGFERAPERDRFPDDVPGLHLVVYTQDV